MCDLKKRASVDSTTDAFDSFVPNCDCEHTFRERIFEKFVKSAGFIPFIFSLNTKQSWKYSVDLPKCQKYQNLFQPSSSNVYFPYVKGTESIRCAEYEKFYYTLSPLTYQLFDITFAIRELEHYNNEVDELTRIGDEFLIRSMLNKLQNA